MAIELFIIFLVAGLMLVGAEVFVPGGILGIMGAVSLLGAIVCSFIAFPGYGAWIALLILVLSGLAIYLWIRIFPNTPIGKRMTVSTNLADSKATELGLEELVGREGSATSDLRPGGFAQIEGKRIDVVTRGEMLDKGDRVRVVEVEGNRVVVKKVEVEKEREEECQD